ncbi:clathrin interactor EPSIN 2 isoform X2 [Selaginella moellendorffii]|uniref:clathrin interactor EPSIN 2 isoform X2 n=1 Tax=Selaginella moellendorffii TaxID=88036 RepID=UPI000D1C2EF5|nr:clathrin interactor EPSIN 2 isoform X2 [Selaginella moellendorffii]|eukprot:XP_024545711.1 clathrin interactor EPSIN 2 isoform X2 [Selaginella moellendorffii]
MAFKKAFGQTVRELKREVNKFRLPEIEIKVQEATSNEPWGPHGSLMTEIADATVDPNELQLIMGVLQKRLLDTGKNWRHVYKSMTVMEFLVANGSPQAVESVISFLSQLMARKFMTPCFSFSQFLINHPRF